MNPARSIALLGAFGALAAAELPPEMRQLIDERAVVTAVDGIDAAVDAKDWALCKSRFADEVDVDFTSFGAPAPARVTGEQLCQGWATNLFAEKRSLHLRTNHQVVIEGDRARVHSHGYAWNQLAETEATGKGDLWEVWGTYGHRLARTSQGWKVDAFTFTKTYERGNSRIPTAQR